jgi:putative transposase
VPTYSPTKIVTIIKSILAKKIFERHPEIKKILWGGEFWSDGHFVSTVSKHGDEEIIANYVKSQGTDKNYRQLYRITDDKQMDLFSE